MKYYKVKPGSEGKVFYPSRNRVDRLIKGEIFTEKEMVRLSTYEREFRFEDFEPVVVNKNMVIKAFGARFDEVQRALDHAERWITETKEALGVKK